MTLRGTWVGFAGLLLLGVLPACQPAAQPPRAVSNTVPDNPVLGFVSSAQAGQSGLVADPQLGQVRVTFLEEYPAASGEICRRFSVETASGQGKAGAACYNGTSWELAPLLP